MNQKPWNQLIIPLIHPWVGNSIAENDTLDQANKEGVSLAWSSGFPYEEKYLCMYIDDEDHGVVIRRENNHLKEYRKSQNQPLWEGVYRTSVEIVRTTLQILVHHGLYEVSDYEADGIYLDRKRYVIRGIDPERGKWNSAVIYEPLLIPGFDYSDLLCEIHRLLNSPKIAFEAN